MSKSKRLMVIFSVLCLLLLPVTSSYACYDGQRKTGTSLTKRIIVPISLQQGSFNTTQRWVAVPGTSRLQRVSISYRLTTPYSFKPSEPVPVTPVEPPAPDPTPDPTPDPAPDPVPDPVPDPAPDPAPAPAPDPPASTPSPSPQPPPPTVSPPAQFQISAEEQLMWELVNTERTSRGLKALQIHEGLVEQARLKSQDMITHNYFAHQSPTYGSPFDMMRQAGISYSFAGENLAGSSTVESAHRNLMNSPGHRANILNPNFTHIGIGIIDGGPYRKMFTQMFIGVN